MARRRPFGFSCALRGFAAHTRLRVSKTLGPGAQPRALPDTAVAPGGEAETRERDRRAPRTYFDDASVTGGRARNGGPPSSREAGLRSPETFSAPRCPRGRLPPPPRRPSLSPPHYGHAGHSCFSPRPGLSLSSPLAQPLASDGAWLSPGFRAGGFPGGSVMCREGRSLFLFCPPACADAPGG